MESRDGIFAAWMVVAAACSLAACGSSDDAGGPAGDAGGPGSSGADATTSSSGSSSGGSSGSSGSSSSGSGGGSGSSSSGSSSGGGSGSSSGSSSGGTTGDGGFPPGDSQPPNPVSAQSPWTINSPDGQTVVTVWLDNGALSYGVDYAGQSVIGKTGIGLQTSPVDFSSGLQYQSGATDVVNETFTLPGGKRSPYVNHANELTLKFEKGSSEIDLVLRAYDEGGAYRFAIPSGGSYTINSETGGFAIPSGTTGWAAPPAADYQGLWDSQTEASLTSSSWEMPVLVKEPSGAWAFVSEAAVYGSVYWGSSVNGQPGMLSLSAGDSNANVSTPFVTPWRVAMVGTDLAKIVESTMLENLNPPSDLVTDTSWIKSGRSAWSWWSGDSTSDYTVQTQYVDFASSMGWEYYLCDAGWDASWMPMLVQYAAGKNVGIWIWYDGSQLKSDADINNMISQAAGWGAKGVKVDYMFGDALNDLAKYDKVAAAAANALLMVNFHGSTKPSGERRRWPHNLTREAIFGAEQYKGGTGPTAKFNCILPFTRNVQGPMDYTPVTYSDMGGQTTYAHQTALDVVFESGVQHLADKPSSYTSNAAQPFLKAVPARWDDTRLLEGDPGSYATLARRSGTSWFVGSIADAARTASVSLSFLDAGTTYAAQIYQDGSSDTDQSVSTQMVTSSSTLMISVRQHGGFAIQLTAQ